MYELEHIRRRKKNVLAVLIIITVITIPFLAYFSVFAICVIKYQSSYCGIPPSINDIVLYDCKGDPVLFNASLIILLFGLLIIPYLIIYHKELCKKEEFIRTLNTYAEVFYPNPT